MKQTSSRLELGVMGDTCDADTANLMNRYFVYYLKYYPTQKTICQTQCSTTPHPSNSSNCPLPTAFLHAFMHALHRRPVRGPHVPAPSLGPCSARAPGGASGSLDPARPLREDRAEGARLGTGRTGATEGPSSGGI